MPKSYENFLEHRVYTTNQPEKSSGIVDRMLFPVASVKCKGSGFRGQVVFELISTLAGFLTIFKSTWSGIIAPVLNGRILQVCLAPKNTISSS